MINVILADDQNLVREGLKMLLSLDTDINVTAEAENGEQLIHLLNISLPDVILMDVRMPVMNGVEATGIIKKLYPKVKIIILTTFNEDEYIFNGIKNGADGYILKDAGSDDIIKAIKTTYNGDIHLAPQVATKLVRAYNSINIKNDFYNSVFREKSVLTELTSREQEVAKLIAKGHSNKEICKILFLTEGTVRNYVTKILEKLELNNRTELAVFINNLK
ncbi:two component transcriptional regulator, LuxR family [Clostridium acidisoli DSM 12555]|jgi:DNA-binding NarL/FixJ family response regulator|uniref:Stage 0 sporulation protein A homolog n=1 Tax=Clostridium acidisoli DSM 12555 TaxID=1121291 RepID=A0A1W1XKS8_9CLOT|nr:response regulator transcription factor [Clostridium acidisoli]SMC24151.1 two component transcriptional regulator, LuxR family [Clostridium acidisoli DSM 12555]